MSKRELELIFDLLVALRKATNCDKTIAELETIFALRPAQRDTPKKKSESNIVCDLETDLSGLACILGTSLNLVEANVLRGMPVLGMESGNARINIQSALLWWLAGSNDAYIEDRAHRGQIRSRARKWLREYADG
jgi:hypothetical protein